MNNIAVESVNTLQYLGVGPYRSLSFILQVRYMRERAFARTRILRTTAKERTHLPKSKEHLILLLSAHLWNFVLRA